MVEERQVSRRLTDIQERTKSEAQEPTPQIPPLTEKPRMFAVTRVTVAPGAAHDIDAAFQPEFWLLYARHGADTDGFYIAVGGEGSQTVWQRADRAIKVPGIGTRLRVQSDAATDLTLYIIAASNVTVEV